MGCKEQGIEWDNTGRTETDIEDKGNSSGSKKYKEGLKHVSKGFPWLYMEPCPQLCDRPTLQLVKWIETYNICMGSIREADTKTRRKYIAVIKRAFKRKTSLRKYGQIILLKESKSTLIRRDTGQLKNG